MSSNPIVNRVEALFPIDFAVDPLTLPVETLKAILESLDRGLEEHLIYKGRCLAALAAKGVNIPRDNLSITLQRVGEGTVMAAVYLRFHTGREALMMRLSALTLSEQKRIMDGAPIEVAFRSGSEFATQMLPVDEITIGLQRQVFTRRGVRTPDEQMRWIKSQEIKAIPKSRPAREGVVLNHKKRSVNINGMEFHANDLAELLRRLLEE